MTTYSRRAFLTGAVTTAVVLALETPAALAGEMPRLEPARFFEPTRAEVDAWIADYKTRCAQVQSLWDATMSDKATLAYVPRTIIDQATDGGTKTVEETRAWLREWDNFERSFNQWEAKRTHIARAIYSGYCTGADGIKPEDGNPPRERTDMGFAWWNGFYVGVADRKSKYG